MQRSETDPKTDTVKKHLDTFVRTFPKDLVPRASPMRLHCVFSRTDKVSSEKTADHRGEFENQLRSLEYTIVHTLKLTWKFSIHPDFFAKEDAKTAWSAVETLFSSPMPSPTP